MNINEHPEVKETSGTRAALTSPRQHLPESAQQCCSASSPHPSLASPAAEAAMSDIDVYGEHSTCLASHDDCDTPRYIPCKARYGVGSTAVLVELLHGMED
ncbi:unspecified product [Leishmania tarentolae]|uniref:Unspecified product n=1 Tax=Leishmania tarentolae TaxID=5689 RepID=A0A640KB97_LEITA|nr:unspecified product [Leishmania tarentolae]